MHPNINAINNLIQEKFKGNKAAFALVLGINRSHVSLILNNKGKGAGAVFLGALINYCQKEGLDFKDYIFLDSSVNILTEHENII